ncbi:glycosyltransferase [Lentisalinibacter sediminis]|uniref:glycosyltransferase n=1 Tax=Lentisalinibacter sediminis TaxID=2992237 RepID=UPI00386CE27A
MTKLRILHIRSSSEILGAERVVVELCNSLTDQGCLSILGVPTDQCGRGSKLKNHAESEGITVKEFPISGPFDLSVLSRIREYVRENRIDVVHSHGYRENFYAFSCRHDAKIIATNHLWKKTTMRLRVYASLDAKLLRHFPIVVAVSSEIAEDMRNSGIDGSKIHIVSNGIDTNVFAPSHDDSLRRELGLKGEWLVYGTVSSLTPEKAINNAIQAIADCSEDYPNICLVIVGDGPQAEVLERLVDRCGARDRVFFAGRRSDMSAVYGAMDIFMLPSLVEGLPMALLEAMSSGLPVIATDVGDVRIAVDEQVGCLVQSGDVEALSSSIRSLACDFERRTQLGRNARQRILTKFSSAIMTNRYLKLYKEMLTND